MEILERKIIKALEAEGLEGATFKEQDVIKNNGIVHKGLSIVLPGCTLSPTLYPEDMFAEGATMEDIVAMAVNEAKKIRVRSIPDLDQFTNWESNSDKVKVRLAKANPEYLADKVYIPREGGLAEVFFIPVEGVAPDGGTATLTVTTPLMDTWGVTTGELRSAAIRNTAADVSVFTMGEIMLRSLEESPMSMMLSPMDIKAMAAEADATPMLVLTNRHQQLGNGVILAPEVLKDACERLNASTLILIPSSIHEWLAIDGDQLSLDEATAMVEQVNATDVLPQERMDDMAYLYNPKDGLSFAAERRAS